MHFPARFRERIAHLSRSSFLLARLFRTVIHLRFYQIFFRLLLHLPNLPVSKTCSLDLKQMPRLDFLDSKHNSNLIQNNILKIHGESLDIAKCGWNDDTLPKLTLYNLHYFDYLNSADGFLAKQSSEALIKSWLDNNPVGKGVGWDPYPTSLRIVNWVKWIFSDSTLPAGMQSSLGVQARWLNHRMEKHLQGNHLFSNAKALIFAGVCFEGAEPAKWVRRGVKTIGRQIDEQILSDGGHFERSPMYHGLFVKDILDLLVLVDAAPHSFKKSEHEIFLRLRRHMPDLMHWYACMTHPDGQIAFFNDTTFNVAPSFDELAQYAEKVGINQKPCPKFCEHLNASGFARLAAGEAIIIADVGNVGPSYLPGHAHAGTLSFELSVKTNRVIVNSGVSVYGTGEERQRQRGTAAHSTLTLGHENSSEIWAGFRVGRRASVDDVIVYAGLNGGAIGATHDGYKHLRGQPMHRREITLASDSITVIDKVSGNSVHDASIRYYLAPNVSAKRLGGSAVLLLDENGQSLCKLVAIDECDLAIAKSTWHPEFGTSIPSSCIVLKFGDAASFTHRTLFEF